MVSPDLCFCLFSQFILLSTGFVIGTHTKGTEKSPVITGQVSSNYFKQKLDHDSRCTQYFTQKYLINAKTGYEPGRPVFLIVGGATELNFGDITEDGYWTDFAIESRALLIALEHRMYGSSFPNNRDYSMLSLAYLNTKQALADLVYFIHEFVRNNPTDINIPPDAKLVALGYSYGGTLAVLLKSKYPDLISAVVTFDAPLLATVEFQDFYNNVENQYKMNMVDGTVKDALKDLKDRFNSCEKNNTFKIFQLECIETEIISRNQEIFNFCMDRLSYNYSLMDHKTFLFWSLATILARTVQFQNGRTYRKEKSADVINILLNKENIPDALERLGAAVKLVLEKHKVKCFVVDYGSLINKYKDTSILARTNLNYILITGLGYRQNLYQHCSEWGQFETADKNDGIFAKLIPIDFYMKLCKRVFGRRSNVNNLKKATDKINTVYGGREINVNNVLFLLRENNFWKKLSTSDIKREGSDTILFKSGQAKYTEEWKNVFRTLENWLGFKLREINNAPKNNDQVPGRDKNGLIEINDSDSFSKFFKKKPNNG